MRRLVTSKPSTKMTTTQGEGIMSESTKAAKPARETTLAGEAAHAKEASEAEKEPGAVQSKYFKRATERARKIAGNPQKLREIADRASKSAAMHSGPFEAVLDDFRALIRLVVAYARGHYRQIPADALVVVVGALIYVVSPADLIPDAIPGIGLIDDVAVVGWVIKTVKGELDSFREWEVRATDSAAAQDD